MLVSLLLLASLASSATPAAPAFADDPPIRVWFNSGGDYAPGERAKVYAKAEQDGYLIVLRADDAGRVRVLFPLDPEDSQQIKARKKYELKGRGGREAFVAGDEGPGTVLAAVSDSPFQLAQFTKEGRWDLRAFSTSGVRDDAESGLLDLVRRMNPANQPFEYDVATYAISERFARDRYLYPYPYAGFGYWSYDPWFRYGSAFGSPYWLRRRYYYDHPRVWVYR
jgi:hypothetical protein